jgi:hypothetical protein
VLSFLASAVGLYLAVTNATPKVREYLVWFWMEDLPRLGGVQRIYIYLGLFLTAWFSTYARPHLGDSPLQAPELYAYTLPKFFSLEGAMKILHSSMWINHTTIHFIRMLTVCGFLACILGVGGQLPPVLVGIGMFLMHGIVQGCIGTSHRWYVPVYTCLALMFANGNADLSLDAYFAREYGKAYPFQPYCWTHATSSILCSGFARKMILLSGISTLFFGAITKMLNGGWAWLDGASLSYYVSSEENGRSVLLKNLMAQYRVISLLLSFGSIGLEAGSIAAVFIPWTRPLIIVSAAGLHLGIWLTMWPNYFPQTVCYGLGMSWNFFSGSTVDALSHRFPVSEWSLLPCWIGVGVWMCLSMVALLRIEYWPLTGIPMYSFYRDSSYSYRFLRDASQAQGVALEHLASGYPNAIAWSNLWITLRLKNMDPAVISARRAREALERSSSPERAALLDRGDKPSADAKSAASSEREFVNLKTRVTDSRFTVSGCSGVYLKQWRRTLHNIAALDMASKPWGHIEEADPANQPAKEGEKELPAKKWLRDLLPHLRRYARGNTWNLPPWVERFGELQLRVKLKGRYAILATIPWNAEGVASPRTGVSQKQQEEEPLSPSSRTSRRDRK